MTQGRPQDFLQQPQQRLDDTVAWTILYPKPYQDLARVIVTFALPKKADSVPGHGAAERAMAR